MATVDDKKIIFSMVGLNKTIKQTNKTILKNIYLSFFYGAKIGIIGLNGAGKSTLMKVLTGIYKKDSGTITYEGKEVEFKNTREAPYTGIVWPFCPRVCRRFF